MAKKPKEEEEGEAEGTTETKLVPKSTLLALLKADERRKEQVDKINGAFGEQVNAAIENRGLDKDVFGQIKKLDRRTGEYLANWKRHFDDMWVKSGLAKRAEDAPTLGLPEREAENEDDPKKAGAKSGTKPSGATVTRFPVAAE